MWLLQQHHRRLSSLIAYGRQSYNVQDCYRTGVSTAYWLIHVTQWILSMAAASIHAGYYERGRDCHYP